MEQVTDTMKCILVLQMQQWIKERHDHIVGNLTVYDITDLMEKLPVNSKNEEGGNRYPGIYTVYGERVNNIENLQQGIYIINGHKKLIRH